MRVQPAAVRLAQTRGRCINVSRGVINLGILTLLIPVQEDERRDGLLPDNRALHLVLYQMSVYVVRVCSVYIDVYIPRLVPTVVCRLREG